MQTTPVVPADSSHRYHQDMKQVITRMPEALHQQAKDEAARREQSLNDFMIDALTAALGDADHPPLRARAAALGLLANPPAPTGGASAAERARRHQAWLAKQPEGAVDAAIDTLIAQRRDAPW